MKFTLLGFKFEAHVEPTGSTLLRYREWQIQMKRRRCLIFHSTGVSTHPDYPGHLWYCCRDCKDSWLTPKKGA